MKQEDEESRESRPKKPRPNLALLVFGVGVVLGLLLGGALVHYLLEPLISSSQASAGQSLGQKNATLEKELDACAKEKAFLEKSLEGCRAP